MRSLTLALCLGAAAAFAPMAARSAVPVAVKANAFEGELGAQAR